MNRELDLEGLVKKVADAKQNLKIAKEEEAKLSNELKKELSAYGIDRKEFPDVKLKVSYTPTVKSTMNNELLLKILKDIIDASDNEDVKQNVKDCIKLVEEVDEDKVTDLVYSGLINIEDIQPAYEEKTTRTLRVGELKC